MEFVTIRKRKSYRKEEINWVILSYEFVGDESIKNGSIEWRRNDEINSQPNSTSYKIMMVQIRFCCLIP